MHFRYYINLFRLLDKSPIPNARHRATSVMTWLLSHIRTLCNAWFFSAEYSTLKRTEKVLLRWKILSMSLMTKLTLTLTLTDSQDDEANYGVSRSWVDVNIIVQVEVRLLCANEFRIGIASTFYFSAAEVSYLCKRPTRLYCRNLTLLAVLLHNSINVMKFIFSIVTVY